MGRLYEQLRLSERIEIYRLRSGGMSLRRIATALGRAPSTISREIARNSRRTKAWPGGYAPARADALARRRRRWDCRFKLERQPDLRALVRDLLAMGWSPEQIAGRLTREQGRTVISHESIYRYAYHRTAQKDYWNRLLPMRKHRRGRIRRGGVSPVTHIKHRVSIHHRPDAVTDRSQPGHWESDLMLFATYGQAVLIAHERSSRILFAVRRSSKAADPVARALKRILEPLPSRLRRSITFDNGTEFARHYRLTRTLGMQTYFCDPYAPWQKGGVENAIRRMRRHLPRKTDIAKLNQSEFDSMIANYNNTPRKCLDYRTPAEVFLENIEPLHFKCEPTLPPSRE